ncbi:MAG: hypothetical protein K8R87_01770 [Verrucomicrobia bacterium]|nr:hypothetical protein [Verrucomicrobiota bacterium]
MNKEAFDFIALPECDLDIHEISETTFSLGISSSKFPATSPREFACKGSHVSSYFLMAINVATLGHFEWASKSNMMTSFSLVNESTKQILRLPLNLEYQFPTPKSQLTSGMMMRAAQLMFALAREGSPHVRTEYLKGIYHFGFSYFDLSFAKDAFANFYRSFEYFVTQRILKLRKLSNEKKQIVAAMKQIGLNDSIIEMFSSEIYPLRGGQVMHAQNDQTEIEWEHVAKTKLLADVMMHELYKPIWEKHSNNDGMN